MWIIKSSDIHIYFIHMYIYTHGLYPIKLLFLNMYFFSKSFIILIYWWNLSFSCLFEVMNQWENFTKLLLLSVLLVNIHIFLNECENYFAKISINLQDVLQVTSKCENSRDWKQIFTFLSVPPEMYAQARKCSEHKTILRMLPQVFIGSIVCANIYRNWGGVGWG